MKVVDISSWQTDDEGNSTVKWQALVDEGIEGVIIKVGENGKLDEAFISHINKAVECGLKVGIYVFSHAASPEEAQAEADWTDEQIKTYLNGVCPELGIWFDAEHEDMTAGDVTAACSAFISNLNGKGYQVVGIYSGWKWLSDESGEQQIHMDQLADYVPYWVAQYNSVCDLKTEQPNKVIRIWQYTDHYSDDLPYDGNEYFE